MWATEMRTVWVTQKGNKVRRSGASEGQVSAHLLENRLISNSGRTPETDHHKYLPSQYSKFTLKIQWENSLKLKRRRWPRQIFSTYKRKFTVKSDSREVRKLLVKNQDSCRSYSVTCAFQMKPEWWVQVLPDEGLGRHKDLTPNHDTINNYKTS